MLFLNPDLCKELRRKVSTNSIFTEDIEYKKYYSLLCAVMDRLDSCIRYLNQNADKPKTEEAFLSFIMFSCTVVDSVKQLLRVLGISNPFSNPQSEESCMYFKEICQGYPLCLKPEKYSTDEKFLSILDLLVLHILLKLVDPYFIKKEKRNILHGSL